MSRRFALLLIWGLTVGLPSNAHGEDRWALQIEGFFSQATATPLSGARNEVPIDLKVNSGVGLDIAYSINKRWRAAVSYLDSSAETKTDFPWIPNGINIQNIQNLDLDILSLAVGYDFFPNQSLCVVIAPTLNYIRFGAFQPIQYVFNWGGDRGVGVLDLDLDPDVALGIDLGLRVPLGYSRWIFSFEVRYIAAEAAGSDFGMTMFVFGTGITF